jgi:hypothetical protein
VVSPRTLKILVVFIMVVGLSFIYSWAGDAYERSEEAYNKADQDRWLEEYHQRGEYGGWLIIGATAAVVVLFMTPLLDKEEEVPVDATDRPGQVVEEGGPEPTRGAPTEMET